jgi:hypothetical protein
MSEPTTKKKEDTGINSGFDSGGVGVPAQTKLCTSSEAATESTSKQVAVRCRVDDALTAAGQRWRDGTNVRVARWHQRQRW